MAGVLKLAADLKPGDRVLRLHDDGLRRPHEVESVEEKGYVTVVHYTDGGTGSFALPDHARVEEDAKGGEGK